MYVLWPVDTARFPALTSLRVGLLECKHLHLFAEMMLVWSVILHILPTNANLPGYCKVCNQTPNLHLCTCLQMSIMLTVEHFLGCV